MIKIIDYGMGNCGSIRNMLRYLGAESKIINQPEQLQSANAIVLPGVGSFDHGIERLAPFRPLLEECVLTGKIPFLGICLGMQLLFESSAEGVLPGLGWINGHFIRFNFSGLKTEKRLVIPHMGWNEVFRVRNNHLFKPHQNKERFYFVHSYHAVNVPDENVLARCHYGYDFTCAVQNDNVYGVQFHPEKSHKFGKQLFRNFIELALC